VAAPGSCIHRYERISIVARAALQSARTGGAICDSLARALVSPTGSVECAAEIIDQDDQVQTSVDDRVNPNRS
jgi:hypothetical protein